MDLCYKCRLMLFECVGYRAISRWFDRLSLLGRFIHVFYCDEIQRARATMNALDVSLSIV